MKDYLIPISPSSLELERSRIRYIGFGEWFKAQVDKFLNCCKERPENSRIYTDSYMYKSELSITKALVEEFSDDVEKDLNLLSLRHHNNLQYEKKHNLVYTPKPTKEKPKRTRNKQASMDFDEPKSRVVDLSLLTIKIKPKHDGN